ncbi:MAG: biotin/lipoyl-containing protein, partial [Pseudomonadota bacterium]
MATIDVTVPDIGDFSDVPVIGIMVSVGDVVAEEDPLIELESDKATMEVPAPAAGKVISIAVSEGDAVSEGSAVLTLEAEEAGDAQAEEAPKEEAKADAPAERPKQEPPKTAPAPGAHAEGKGELAPVD